MRKRSLFGFALPTILISSLIMLTVLSAVIMVVGSTLVGLSQQGYVQMAQDASQSGTTFAENCLRESNGIITWSDDDPLTPYTDCSGNALSGLESCSSASTNSACFLSLQDNVKTTFSVGMPDMTNPGKYSTLKSVGTVYITKTSSGAVWKQYSQTTTSKAAARESLVTDGLAMNIDFNDASSYPVGGYKLSDLSGADSNCSANGAPKPQITNGITSLKLNGSSDYIDCSKPAILANRPSVTYSGWFYPTADTAGKGYMLITKELQYKYALLNDHVYVLVGYDGAGSWDISQPDGLSQTVGLNKWWNFVMTVDSSAKKITLYINGAYANSWTMAAAITAYNTKSTGIGVYDGDSTLGSLFQGNIGQVAIYTRALSASEVSQNFEVLRGRYGL